MMAVSQWAEFRQYFASARQLAKALSQNRSDGDFAERVHKPGKIVYILDTNVVVHYVEQRRGAGNAEFSFGHFLSEGSPALVNDQLTIEYLLSGKLPGQSEAPAYMMPPHWNEVLNRASDVARKLDKAARSLHYRNISQLQAEPDPRKRFELAERMLPDWIVEALKVAPAMQRRLHECFATETPKIEPLDRHPNYWTDAMHLVRGRDIDVWRRAVQKVPKSQTESKTRHQRNLESDLLVLALMQTLYREFPEACGPNPEVSFLFVTADQRLAHAVESMTETLTAEQIPMFARHPRVFSPLLNFANMSRLSQTGEMFKREEFKTVFLEVDQTLQRLLVRTESEKRGRHVANVREYRREIETAIEVWTETARKLVVAQAHFFHADSDAIAAAAKLLNDPQGLIEASQFITETIASVRQHHVRFQSLDALERLSAPTSSKNRRRPAIRRAPIQVIGVDLLASIRRSLPKEIVPDRASTGVAGLYQLLDRIALAPGSERDEILQSIGRALLEDWERPETQLLAACIYLADEAWPSARDCAKRCRDESQPPSLLRREADYCFALASRFIVDRPGVFIEAREALVDHRLDYLAEKSPTSAFARLREIVEHAALLSSASLMQAIDDATPMIEQLSPESRLMEKADISRFFEQAHNLERNARKTLDSDFSGVPDDGDVALVLRMLRLQLHTNIVGTHLFRHTLDNVSREPFDRAELESDLARLEEEAKPNLPKISRIYLTVGHAILQGEPWIADGLRLLENELRQPGLAFGDALEFRNLCDHLRRMRLDVTRRLSPEPVF